MMNFLGKIRLLATSTQGLPIVLSLTIIAILFVLFRMKGVEVDYKLNTVNAQIEEASLENKSLKAQKAKLLSVKRLRRLAVKHRFLEPKQEQIIVVP